MKPQDEDMDDLGRGPQSEREADETVSKSQRKREAHALQDLGERLVQLDREQLARMPLSDELRDAISLARSIRQRGGRKRQMQYIGKLMRSVDAEPIRDALLRIEGRHAEDIARQHRIERWRDRLLEEGDEAIAALKDAYPDVDIQRVRQTVRQCQRERETGKPPKSARVLFRYIRELDTGG